jgi:hypothetical protein
MGVDVGFSMTRLTTGIACLDGDQLYLLRAGTTWESRQTTIPRGFQPALIALDRPLLPQGADKLIRRHCESVFIRAPFHNRCKPGLTHWGRGLEFRHASTEALTQFSRVLAGSAFDRGGGFCFPQRGHRGSVSEWVSGSLDAGRGIAVCTQAEARATVRLVVRTDGNDRQVGVRAVKKPGTARRSLAPLELRDGRSWQARVLILFPKR